MNTKEITPLISSLHTVGTEWYSDPGKAEILFYAMHDYLSVIWYSRSLPYTLGRWFQRCSGQLPRHVLNEKDKDAVTPLAKKDTFKDT